jgi:hypothetical protein
MSIWVYGEKSRESAHFNWFDKLCAFCEGPLLDLEADIVGGKSSFRSVAEVSVCNQCGWWIAHKSSSYTLGAHRVQRTMMYGAAASLRELDLTDISLPIDEVRDYLTARFEKRMLINPRTLEETVGSIFRDLGWGVKVTAYSGDDGIDAFLEKDGQTIGVQVKRYGSNIEVEQIRSLAGALLLKGLTKGIFVTTSSFQRGAQATVDRLAIKGYAIELMNSDRLFDALRIAQRKRYRSGRDFPRKLLDDLPLISGYSIDPYYRTMRRLDPKAWKWSKIRRPKHGF